MGRVRDHNEDHWHMDTELGLWVVCDGMGGHASGEVASQWTTETVREIVAGQRAMLSAGDADALASLVRHAIEEASRRLHAAAEADPTKRGMGTTCTALLLRDGKGVMGHVGDSRLYLLRAGQIHQLSEDHTFAAEAVRSGIMTPQQAKESVHSNIVTRAVGPHAKVKVDTLVFDVLPGDTLLLCSDGLSQYVEDDLAELAGELGGDVLDTVAERLVALANERGGSDNITAVVLRAEAARPPEEAEMTRASEVRAELEVLRQVELFRELEMARLVRLASHVRKATYAPGDVILREGEVSEALYVLVDGEAAVTREGSPLASLSAGSHFGEMALLSHRPRSATVTATQRTRVLVLGRAGLDELVREDPVAGVKVLWQLAQTLSVRLDDAFVPRADASPPDRRTLEYALFPSPFTRKG